MPKLYEYLGLIILFYSMSMNQFMYMVSFRAKRVRLN